MKPVTYQITNGNAICLAGLAAVSFETNEAVSAIVYASNKLYIHRCKSERVEELFATQLGKLLTPPVIEEASNIEYKELTFKFDGKSKKDLWFSGFGFIFAGIFILGFIYLLRKTSKYIKTMEVFHE